MLYWKIRLKEIIERYWLRKSKKLFIKYSKLSKFTYDYEFDFNLNEIWDDHISVGIDDDVKRYYIVDNREAYKELKSMLSLELEIRYDNEDTDS